MSNLIDGLLMGVGLVIGAFLAGVICIYCTDVAAGVLGWVFRRFNP